MLFNVKEKTGLDCRPFSYIGAAGIVFVLFLLTVRDPGLELVILVLLFPLLVFVLRQLCEGSGMFKEAPLTGDIFERPVPWFVIGRQRRKELKAAAKAAAAGRAPVRAAPAPAAAPAATPEPAPAPKPTPAAAAEEAAPSDDDKPQLLTAARDGNPDDLKQIKGVGPKLEGLLHKLGVFHFDQIASWSEKEVGWVDYYLEGFKGRVSRDDWVSQAKTLATGGTTEFAERVSKGEVASSQSADDT
ncbi:MAG: endonuclease [Pseudomonadota bacterium]